MNENNQERKRIKKYKKNPVANLSDSVNQSMIGNLGASAKGGCFTKIIALVINISIFLILSYCSN